MKAKRISMEQFQRDYKRREEIRRAAMPPWLLTFQDILDEMPHCCGGGIGGVIWPSHMGGNHMIVSGDGICMFCFEILDPIRLIRPNQFRFVGQRHGVPLMPACVTDWCRTFLTESGAKLDDVLTYDQVKDGLTKMVAHYQMRYSIHLQGGIYE